MAARVRASFTDDDSISDHLALEMVRINAPPSTNNDPDEQTTLNESVGTTGMNTPAPTDFLASSNAGLIDGSNPEYEIPNLFTYRKVGSKAVDLISCIERILDRNLARKNAGRDHRSSNQIRQKFHVQNSQCARRWRSNTMDFKNTRCR